MALTDKPVPASVSEKPRALPVSAGRFLEWPYSAWLLGLGLAALYYPYLVPLANTWLDSETYSHGVFIFPIAGFVLYLRRAEIRAAAVKPTLWGLAPLGLGLLAMLGVSHIRADSVTMWTLIPVLAGAVILLHGWELLRIARFSILYLGFSFLLPWMLLFNTNMWIKQASTAGAATVMKGLGYTVLRTGNLLEIPGYSLEVADVCSGYKKLVALIAFATLYGHLFAIAPWKRVLLVLVTIPIALASNVIRVSGLIAITSAGGLPALHIAHNWAEIVVLVIAFVMFVLVGKALGCKTLRFMRQPD